MNDFLWRAVLCDISLPFPAEKAVTHNVSIVTSRNFPEVVKRS